MILITAFDYLKGCYHTHTFLFSRLKKQAFQSFHSQFSKPLSFRILGSLHLSSVTLKISSAPTEVKKNLEFFTVSSTHPRISFVSLQGTTIQFALYAKVKIFFCCTASYSVTIETNTLHQSMR